MGMEGETLSAIFEAVEQLSSDQSLNHEQYVPRRDYELAVGRLTELEEREAEREEEKIINAVDEVQSATHPFRQPSAKHF